MKEIIKMDYKNKIIIIFQSLLPLLPPLCLVLSVGSGVQSSIRPILNPFLTNVLIAAFPP